MSGCSLVIMQLTSAPDILASIRQVEALEKELKVLDYA